MDLDLLSGYLQDDPPGTGSPGTLLSDSTHSTLTPADNISDYGNSDALVQVRRNINLNQVGAVISKIEDIFESIADCILEDGKELVIELKSRSKSKAKVEDDGGDGTRRRTIKITFPSRNQREAWKFSK